MNHRTANFDRNTFTKSARRLIVGCVFLLAVTFVGAEENARPWIPWQSIGESVGGAEFRLACDGQSTEAGVYIWWYQFRNTFSLLSVRVRPSFARQDPKTKTWENPAPIDDMTPSILLKPGQILPETWLLYFSNTSFNYTNKIEWVPLGGKVPAPESDAGKYVGDPKEMAYLGEFAHGTDDSVTAVKWYRKAAELGEARAMHNLGLCFHEGIAVRQDRAVAFNWMRKAAEKGLAASMTALGEAYRDGDGVAKSPANAIEWFRKAADKEQAKAMKNLGDAYRDGTGVAQDPATAVAWYRMAVKFGDADAGKSLEKMDAAAPRQRVSSTARQPILTPVSGGRPPQPSGFDEQITQANTLSKQGKLSEALTTLQAAGRADPSRFEAPAMAALVLHQAGRAAEAREALADARRIASADKQAKLDGIARIIASP